MRTEDRKRMHTIFGNGFSGWLPAPDSMGLAENLKAVGPKHQNHVAIVRQKSGITKPTGPCSKSEGYFKATTTISSKPRSWPRGLQFVPPLCVDSRDPRPLATAHAANKIGPMSEGSQWKQRKTRIRTPPQLFRLGLDDSSRTCDFGFILAEINRPNAFEAFGSLWGKGLGNSSF